MVVVLAGVGGTAFLGMCRMEFGKRISMSLSFYCILDD
jgi:hypothetical protein